MQRTIIATGIPGTGKTTVCKVVENLAKRTGAKVKVINFGTVMVEKLEEHKMNTVRNAIRKTDIDFQCKLQREAAETILEKVKQQAGITIVDTHMSIKTPQGYLPGLPFHVLQILKPEVFFLVEAKPSEISSRRTKDVTRERDEAVEEAIEQELLFSRLMAGACAVLTGASVKIVINAEGEQEEAANEILRTLRVV